MNELDELKIRRQLERQLERATWKEASILEENMALIREFDNYNAARQMELSTRLHYVKALKGPAAMLGKPFKKVTKKDMIGFIAEFSKDHKVKGVNNVKICVKRFFQWLYDMDEDYPKVVRWMKPKPTKNLIKPEQLITPEELKRILAACRSQRDRALIMLIYERGPRPHEILGMKVGDVAINSYGVKIMLDGKTGARPIPLIDSAPDLQLYLRQHPFRDNKEAPLWLTVKKGEVQPLLYDGFRSILRRLLKRADIKRRVWLYLFRHSALTSTSKQVPESTLRKVAGWVPGSRMPGVYTHLSGADVEKALLKARGLEVEEIEEERVEAIQCPRCERLNAPLAKWCQYCGQVLKEKEAFEAMAIDSLLRDIEKLSRLPGYREIFADMVEYAKTRFAEQLKQEKIE